jgi:hypothetical protein
LIFLCVVDVVVQDGADSGGLGSFVGDRTREGPFLGQVITLVVIFGSVMPGSGWGGGDRGLAGCGGAGRVAGSLRVSVEVVVFACFELSEAAGTAEVVAAAALADFFLLDLHSK